MRIEKWLTKARDVDVAGRSKSLKVYLVTGDIFIANSYIIIIMLL